MSSKKRRYKSNRNNQEYRDSGNFRSVSTNVDKKESSNIASGVRDFKTTSDNSSRNFKKNVRKKHPDSLTNNRDSNRRNEPRENKNQNVISGSNKAELKKQFLKSEMQKYFPVKTRRSGRTNLDRKKLAPYLMETFNIEVCHVCGKNITNMATVLYDEEKGGYAHFDCIYDSVRQRYEVSDKERIAYVGNGAFAVIEDYKEGGVFKFRIKQKIQVIAPRSVK